jgi:hypothetical protein
MSTDRSMRPIPRLVEYAGPGNGNAVIAQAYTPDVGWRDCSMRKRASRSWLRKMRRAGVTHVTVKYLRADTRTVHYADFAIAELLEGA